ncbi:MAG TPA: lysophospholipid acyltransferase family protein [Anaerolineales bacterium]|nr:lysophospholipid acyltransferase family protein [Anaerolineales bacterium]
MPNPPAVPPKPVTDVWRPELTRLPSLTGGRRLYRRFVHYLARFLLWALTRTTFSGLENLPARGPALLVINHLGDADAAILLAALPAGPEVLAKIELLDFPVLGMLMDWYGCVWLHRGRPDRRAVEAALQALGEGRRVIVAPEGRYSLAEGLEEGGKGAAYIAARAGVPVIPIGLTGTQNEYVYGRLRRIRRPHLSLTVGTPLVLAAGKTDRRTLEAGTLRIMQALAGLLPPEHRGAYSSSGDPGQ